MPSRHRSDRTKTFEISPSTRSLCFDLNSIERKDFRLWLNLTNLPHWRRREPGSEKSDGRIPNSYRSMLLYALSLPQVVLFFSLFAILLRHLHQSREMTRKNVRFDQSNIREPSMSGRIFLGMLTEPL